MKVFPDANAVPPVLAEYQMMDPALGLALNVTEPASQRDPGVVEVTDGVVFTVATIGILADEQVPDNASA